jgi:alpha-L-fucosidase 2
MRWLLAAALIWVTGPVLAQETILFFDEPASEWEQALPVGNGRLGAMVFGEIATERIQFNEETLWSGGPYDPVQEGAHAGLPEIQRLLFEGDFAKAHDLFGRTMMGVPYEQMKYQPFGNVYLYFDGHDFEGDDTVTDYRRQLDLDTGIAATSYVVDGVTFTREVYSSAVDQVIVVHLTASEPGAISFSANLHGVRNVAHSNYGTGYFRMDGIAPNQLRLTGKSSTYLGIEGQMRYEARVDAQTEGGRSWVDYRTLHVEGADSATLLIAAATNHVNYKDVSANPQARVAAYLDAATDRDESAMRADHLEEHRQWFRRVSIDFEGDPTLRELPTDERIARLEEGEDPSLAALYYQFGRYLLIASSRPGTQPANLQGIWQDRPNPSWDSKYTININLPMNYWLADSGNLSEMNGPLWMFAQEVAEAGTSTAREHWNADGWVLHQNTDLFRSTTPMDGPSWGAWPVGGAWVMTNLSDHYRFTEDREFLEEMYPVLKGQVEFLLDILVEHPDNGWLVTAPSNSPENFPAWEGNGRFFDEVTGLYLKARTIAVGPTMDMQIIREVFGSFSELAALLGRDEGLAREATDAASKLAPNQIGQHGQLMEWIEDYDEVEPWHRHLSHLWGLYPGSEITPDQTPEMAAASAISIERRGTGGCGWSYGWKMGLWARLYAPGPALHEFKRHLIDSSHPNFFSKCGRTLQVDGTFGATASMAEMLLQSHQGELHLLPALPLQWGTGSVKGLRARGNVEVDMTWENHRLTSVTLHAGSDGPILIRASGMRGVETAGGIDYAQLDAETLTFEAQAGSTYTLTF